MTGNNLREHLAWLLNSKPFVPPLSLFCDNAILTTPTSISQPESAPTASIGPSQAGPPVEYPTSNPASASQPGPALVPETETASESQTGPAVQGVQEMARLRSAPGSAVKPGLVALGSVACAGSTAVIRDLKSPRTAHPAEHILSLISKIPSDPAPHLSGEGTPKKPHGASSRPGLTGSVARAGKQDSPTRSKHVPATAGRKRASEEFGRDMDTETLAVQTKIKCARPMARDNISAEFTSIDDIFGEPPPPYSSVANVVGARERVARSGVGMNAGNAQPETSAIDIEDELSSWETVTRMETKELRSSSVTSFEATVKKAPVSSQPSPSKHRIYSQTKPIFSGPPPTSGRRRRIVADSEDCESSDDGSGGDLQSSSKPTVRPQGPIQAEVRSARDAIALEQHADSRLPDRGSQQEPNARRGCVDAAAYGGEPVKVSPSKRSDPTSSRRPDTLPPTGGSSTLGTIVASQDASVLTLTNRDEIAVRRLLGLGEGRLDRLSEAVEQELGDALEQGFEIVAELGEQPPALMEEIQSCNKRKEHVQRLLEARQRHRHLSEKKAAIKETVKQIMQLEVKDRPQQDVFAETKRITQEIKETEAEIARVLRFPDIVERLGFSITPGACSSMAGIVVGATQLPAREQREYASHRAAERTSDMHELVNQTQLMSPRPHSVQRVQTTAAQMDGRELYRSHTSVEGAFANESVSLFTTVMGTPPPRIVDDDDFGEDDDDAEMLEVADDIENQGVRERSFRPERSRAVFGETSGNQRDSSTTMGRQSGHKLAGKPPALPTLDASLMQHPWSRDVKAVLKDRFHLKGFRKNQLEAINATLSGKNVFVLMPTGGGKSLCYQLPSIIRSGKTRGVTIVISPLLSLMEDQVQHLRDLKIQAFYLNSFSTPEHRRFILNALRDSRVDDFIQLLYVTPEMLNKSQVIVNAFRDLHARQRLARVVIDEAHCVSQWGHDFRPDYKALGDICRQFDGVPVMALTATATENVKVDVIHNLGINGCKVFVQTFNRPNLTYEVRDKGKDILAEMAEIITKNYARQSGIIYCLSRRKCEEVAEKLRTTYRIKAQHYHAGMAPEEKVSVQKRWQAGHHHVIVATIAFGMGIDKGDVRFVIHHSIPKSLEGYYQETGRAGRDGKRSGCYLYFSYHDTTALKRMIDASEGSREQIERQHQMLRNVVQFCDNKSDCRRVQVLAYFGERFEREDCKGACDNCTSTSKFENRDLTSHAVAAIRLVREMQGEKVTLMQCVDAFRGARTRKARFGELHGFGAGADLDRGEVERIFQRLLSENALKENNVVNKAGFATQYILLGRSCNDYRDGKQRLQIQVRISPNGKAAEPKQPQANRASKKRKSGAAATGQDYPLSTNVSSPVQAAARRRATKRRTKHAKEADTGLDMNSYARDSFVVADDVFSDEDDEDEAFQEFAPIRDAGRTQISRPRQLGPPITADARVEQLDENHVAVVDNFLNLAKEECEGIMLRKSLREQPFSDTVLREMAIRFPKNERELLKIPGIDSAKVMLYGKQFLPLIRESSNFLRELNQQLDQQDEDQPHDPNREVINVSSDTDDNENGDLDLEIGSSPAEQRSSYFKPTAEVHAFNAQFSATQARAPDMRPPPPPSPREWQRHANSSVAPTHSRYGSSESRSGTFSGRGRNSGGHRKRARGAGAKKSADENPWSELYESNTSARRGAPGGGIGMMPT